MQVESQNENRVVLSSFGNYIHLRGCYIILSHKTVNGCLFRCSLLRKHTNNMGCVRIYNFLSLYARTFTLITHIRKLHLLMMCNKQSNYGSNFSAASFSFLFFSPHFLPNLHSPYQIRATIKTPKSISK